MRFVWTRRAVERLTWLSLEGKPLCAIAEEIGCHVRTARQMQWELGVEPRRPVKRWSESERATLRRMYAGTKTEDIAKVLQRPLNTVYQQAAKLGLQKSAEYMASPAACRLRRDEHPGKATQFRKGIVPHNKGLRRPGWAPGRMRETQFKKGERRGKAAGNWKPVGTILADDEGYLRIKVRESNSQDRCFGFGNVGIWPMMQRQIWQQQNGPIPPSHAICFKDGDRKNCAIENLELVSRAELMRRNTIHTRYPKDVVNTIMLLGAVKRRLRERNAKEHDDGSAQSPVRSDGSAQG